MKPQLLFSLFTLLWLASGCQSKPICPTESNRHFTAQELQGLSTPTGSPNPTPIPVKINGKTVMVDRLVEGPLCNDTWQGTVYVSCNTQVQEWEEEPLFLKDCDLSIAEGTTVYVAYHNDAAYYNGCSCHTGQ